MKIQKNEDTLDFVQNLNTSLMKSSIFKQRLKKYNQQIIGHNEEQKIIEEYKKIGVMKTTLNQNLSELLDNPFNKNIKIPNIAYKEFKYINKILQQRKCLSMSEISFSNDYLLGYFEFGYFDKSVNVPILTEQGKIWMSHTLSEQRSIQRHVDNAHGDILTFGLGLGYYVYMCSLKDSVKSITVIEKNPYIIYMFKTYILPQFKTDKNITIINGDLYDYYTKDFLSKYDFIFVDIWENANDGFYHYKRLMQLEIGNDKNIGYWIEANILEPIRLYVGIYFKALIAGNLTDVLSNFYGDNLTDLKRIHKYFRGVPDTISSQDRLIYYLNNTDTMKEILKMK